MRVTKCRNVFCGRLRILSWKWVCDACYPAYEKVYRILGRM